MVILIILNEKSKAMKKNLLLMLLLVAVMSATAQDVVKVTFTAGTGTGQYCPFTSVVVSNVTRNWTETLNYPDTVLTLTGTGVDEQLSTGFYLGSAFPNPFTGETRIPLKLAEVDEVWMRLFRADGVEVMSQTIRLDEGSHNIIVHLSSPGLAFLSVTTSRGRSVAKLVNEGRVGGDAIRVEAVSVGKRGGIPSRGSVAKEFAPGDVMRYEALLEDGEAVVHSAAVTQPQYIDEMVTLRFSVGMPTVTTNEVTEVTLTSAQCGGDVSYGGGLSVSARGVCWSTIQNPTVSGNHSFNGNGMGSFTGSITGLSAGTVYYVRAYATNALGTTYGAQKTFTTLAPPPDVTLPAVTTNNVSAVTQNSAMCGGKVTSDGNGTVTAFGVCWSTSQNPTIDDPCTVDGDGIGVFTSALTGLAPSTTYYVRAYATNEIGTAYGVQKTFITEDAPPGITIPTVTTNAVSDITQNGAVCGGNVTDDGNGTVTARGVCWSTNPNPSLNDSHSSDGEGVGAYYSTLVGLTAGTTYYVRAYATNSAGTAYGEQKTFATETPPPPVVIPTVTTAEVTGITAFNAICGGNVTDEGNDIAYRGVCWSTSPNPTVEDYRTNDGNGMGEFVSYLIGLTPNTTYYVRAFAANNAGVGYGAQMTFTTEEEGIPVGAIEGIFTVGSEQTVYFSQGNLQYQASTDTWRFADNQWDAIGEDNANVSSTFSGWIDLFGWGTSGREHGAVCYQPWGTSVNDADYYAYGDVNKNLNDETGEADWGYNAISNGGNMGHYWRTLTKDEWKCLLNTRATSSGIRYAKATVNGMTGLILLPDDWQVSYQELYNTNVGDAAFASNVITADQWSNMEQHGAVFLPAAGRRTTTLAPSGVGTLGNYVAATHGNANNNCVVFFNASSVYPNATNNPGVDRYFGQSVRLVRNANVIPAGVLPTVNTFGATDITAYSALGHGRVISDGGSDVMERGVCYTWFPNPILTDYYTNSGEGTGDFEGQMTGLRPNTVYYVRAYATNALGTAYGPQKSFTTAVGVPWVNTLSVSNITQTTATCGGWAENVGGYAVPVQITARGVCWSRSPNPTIANSHTNDGTGECNYTSQITGLQPSTFYYVRAYATNSAGTAYGPQKTFVTAANPVAMLPEVVTGNVAAFSMTTATVNGEVLLDGSPVPTECGAWISTSSPNPSNGGACFPTAGGTGLFQVNLYDLTPGATYYVRAYATNSGGTAFGELKTFTTFSQPEGAACGIFSVSATEQVFFSKGNLQYIGSASTPYWKFADHQWDYIGDNGQNHNTQNLNRDLFGWGTSGYNHNGHSYQPWSTSNTMNHYWAYGNPNYHLYNQSGKADWGYNAISNGGNEEHVWRTPKREEWEYVLFTRETESGVRFAKAKVNDVKGVILLPDVWQESYYLLNNVNDASADYTANIISSYVWTSSLEANGAVFLPAAGSREYEYQCWNWAHNAGYEIYVFQGAPSGPHWEFRGFNIVGDYWSSSNKNDKDAYELHFYDATVGIRSSYPMFFDFQEGTHRCNGYSVRLVRPVE